MTGNIIPIENSQGTNILFNCGILTSFAKGHFFFTTVQEGADWIEFANGSCALIEP